MEKRITIIVPLEVHTALKGLSKADGRTMKVYLTRLLESHVARKST